MSKNTDSSIKLLVLYDILLKSTDEEHALSTNEIIEELKKRAFYGCSGLTSVTIPDSATSIGSCAFRDCTGLTSVTIGNSVTSIGNEAFWYCYKLVEVYNKSALSITAGSSDNGKVAYYAKNVYTNEGGSKLTTDENGYVIYTDGDQKILVAYRGTETELVLPSYITEINNHAFYNCRALTSITIPSSVTVIGGSAFRNCSGLTSITIPNGVTYIGSYAFADCGGLTSIIISNSVSQIGSFVFLNCSNLASIHFKGLPSQWDKILKGDNWNYGLSAGCKITYSYETM